ncbi:hypothetical protein RFI_38763 [Reticulomyxa filosa]|uniref:26S proteasome regulatory subunit RPN2 C-terminal domain-containing protein n=1 Tax=Reticulomyxa filosa TaxID=46433 RepID=X6LC54_RETFI|nr:hypothetical protein RFI_38763 [Reticulomyxa filosa]|eukprot:ETN98721.1 hypothetical protein RFI_38763 [Reticulomyxa filosa]
MVMALNSDLAIPNAPLLYAYPKPLKEAETQEKKTLEKDVLSITAKQKDRDLKKKRQKTKVTYQASITEATQSDKTKDKETITADNVEIPIPNNSSPKLIINRSVETTHVKHAKFVLILMISFPDKCIGTTLREKQLLNFRCL